MDCVNEIKDIIIEYFLDHNDYIDLECSKKVLDEVLTEDLAEQIISKAVYFCHSEGFLGDSFEFNRKGFIIGYLEEYIREII